MIEQAVDEKIEKALVTAVPFGRRGAPEEVANVYALMAFATRKW